MTEFDLWRVSMRLLAVCCLLIADYARPGNDGSVLRLETGPQSMFLPDDATHNALA